MTLRKLVDFHCHLDLYPDFPAAVAAAEAAGVFTLTVTTTPRAWPRNQEVTAQSRCVRAALGLHPQLVAQHAQELPLWESYLPQARYIGEVGLDAGPQYYASLPLQKQVFEHILKACAKAGGKILTVHSVRSASAVLDLLDSHFPPEKGRVVLHWFTGSQAEAKRAAERGCFFSINAQMLRHERGRKLVAAMPLNQLLTESDGPFTEVENRPTAPADIPQTIETLASTLGLSSGELAKIVYQNLTRLLT